MKTLLRRIKRSLLFRLLYRLVCWINYPTSRERMWHMYWMGKVQGKKEAYKELPILQVQPKPVSEPLEHLHLPPGMWSKMYYKTHPEHKSAIPSQQHEHTYWPAPFEEHTWLNSKPRKVEQIDPYDTTESPAIVALLHKERNSNGHH